MKPLYCAIATSVILASLTVPAVQVRADDEVRSNAWSIGYADAMNDKKFDNPYSPQDDPLSNTDYICGYIVGKSARNGS